MLPSSVEHTQIHYPLRHYKRKFTFNGPHFMPLWFSECGTYSNPLPTTSLQKKVHGQWTTLHASVVPEVHQRFNSVWMFTFGDLSVEYKGVYRCMAYNGIGLPAISNTTELLLPEGMLITLIPSILV